METKKILTGTIAMATLLSALSGCVAKKNNVTVDNSNKETPAPEKVEESADTEKTETDKKDDDKDTTNKKPIKVNVVNKITPSAEPTYNYTENNTGSNSSSTPNTPQESAYDRTLRELNEKIEQKSVAVTNAKKVLDDAKTLYNDALTKANIVTGDKDIKEYLAKAKALMEKAQKEYDTALAEYSNLLLTFSDEREVAKKSAENVKNEVINLAKKEFDDTTADYRNAYNSVLEEAESLINKKNEEALGIYNELIAQIEAEYKTKKAEIDSKYSEKDKEASLKKERALSLAQSKYNEAIKAAENTYNEVIKANQEAYDNATTEALEAYNKATKTEAQVRDTALEEAKNAYNKALSEAQTNEAYLNAKATREEATKKLNTLTETRNNIQTELDTANKELETAKVEEAKAKEDYDTAAKTYQDAENAYNEALNAYNQALKDQDNKKNANDFAGEVVKAYKQNLEQAERLLNSSKDDLTTAEKAYEYGQTRIDDAKQAIINKQNALKEAENKVATGVLGFYQSQLDKLRENPSIETGNTEKELEKTIAMLEYYSSDAVPEEIRTKIGQKGDATSLENVKAALELIKRGNEVRTTDDNTPGLKDLKVTHSGMVEAQITANAEREFAAHWVNSPEYAKYNINNVNSNWQTQQGENAYWGSYDHDPYEGWYTDEKIYKDFYIEYLKNNPKATREEIDEAAKKAGTYCYGSNGSWGHYDAITAKGYTSTGLAINNSSDRGVGGEGAKNIVQEFTTSKLEDYKRLTTFTVDEYYEMFMNYYNSVYDGVKNAQAELENAKSELEFLEASGGLTQEEVDEINRAKEKVAQKEQELQESQAEYDKALVDKATSEKELTEAITKVTETENLKNSAKENLDNTATGEDEKKAYEAAQENTNQKQETVNNVETKLDKASEDENNAKKELSDAIQEVQKQETIKAEKEENAKTTYENDVQKANDTYNKNTSDALNDYSKATETERIDKIKADEKAHEVLENEKTDANNTLTTETNTAENEYQNTIDTNNSEKADEVGKLDATTDTQKSDALNDKTKADTEAKAEYDKTVGEATDKFNSETKDASDKLENAKQKANKTYENAIEEADKAYQEKVDQAKENLELDNKKTDVETSVEDYNKVVEADKNLDQAKDNLDDKQDKYDSAVKELESAEKAKEEFLNPTPTIVIDYDSATITLVE